VIDSEEPEEQESNPISNSYALNALNILHKYFCQKGDNSLNENFNEIQRKLTENTFKAFKQLKITNFFN